MVDETTQPIVASLLGRYEIVEMGCASVVRLDLADSRAPQAALDAIYFVKPTAKNLETICNDFRVIQQSFHKCFVPCPCACLTTHVEVKAFMYNEVGGCVCVCRRCARWVAVFVCVSAAACAVCVGA